MKKFNLFFKKKIPKFILLGSFIFIISLFLSARVNAFDSTTDYINKDYLINYYSEFILNTGSGSTTNNDLVLFNSNTEVYEEMAYRDDNNYELVTVEIDQLYYEIDYLYRGIADSINSFTVYNFESSINSFNLNGSQPFDLYFNDFNFYVNENDFGSSSLSYFYDDNYKYDFQLEFSNLPTNINSGDYYISFVYYFTLQFRDQHENELVSRNVTLNVDINYGSNTLSFSPIYDLYKYVCGLGLTTDNFNGYCNISDFRLNGVVFNRNSSNTQLTYNLNVDCPITNFSNKVSSLNVYGGKLQDTLNVDLTTWIAEATSGFINFEIVPGLSIMGIFSICLSIGLLFTFLRFFAGG